MKKVSRMDLTPRLNRTLKLKRPLDYFILLYWLFFFPQAMRHYIDTHTKTRYKNGGDNGLWLILRDDPELRNLALQGYLVVPLISAIIAVIMRLLGLTMNWVVFMTSIACIMAAMIMSAHKNREDTEFALIFSIVLGLTVSLFSLGLLTGENSYVAPNANLDTPNSVGIFVILGLSITFMSCIYSLVMLGLLVNLLVCVDGGFDLGIVSNVLLSTSLGILIGTIVGLSEGWAQGIAVGALNTILILRLPGYLLCLFISKYTRRIINHVTPLPLPTVRRQLKHSLQENWDIGIHNANQLLAYTFQFIPVAQTISRQIRELPEDQLLTAVASLAYDPFDWTLLRVGSTSLAKAIIHDFVDKNLRFSRKLQKHFIQAFDLMPQFHSHAQAACAGFWYLHEGKPDKAVEAFIRVRELPYGKDLYQLARSLQYAKSALDFADIVALAEGEKLINSADHETDLLHSNAMQAMHYLRMVTKEAQTIKHSISQAARSRALNRALGSITDLHGQLETIPEAERGLFAEIVTNWRDALLATAKHVGEAELAGPVRNPYVLNDPVIGTSFVGRKGILRDIEELWVGSEAPASVVLYGHRRMGKTSILRNLAHQLGSSVYLAYINLHILGDRIDGAGDILLAVADEIALTLKNNSLSVVSTDAKTFRSNPYRAFKHFLHKTHSALGRNRLIVAMDEFEQLEKWIINGYIGRDFFKVLRVYVQFDPHIAFVLAGLHKLDEMSGDYFEPFYGSFFPLRVAFLTKTDVFYLLANPSEDFPLYYTPEAQEQIWFLTGGQPFLVQLIGHQLVSRFNDLTFEKGRSPNPGLNREDVAAVVDDPAFFRLGRYYFTGIWGQAAQGAPGQHAALQALARSEKGSTVRIIAQDTCIIDEVIKDALETLQRHDVVKEEDGGRWHFTVELMRRWVLKKESTS